MKTRSLVLAVGAFLASLGAPTVIAQIAPGTGFTYQGVLKDQQQAQTGIMEFRFRLYDSPLGGTQVGPMIQPPPVAVIDGLFTIELDFGSGIFAGNARWLEIEVRRYGGPSAYSTLYPRQKIYPTPYAMFGLNGGAGTQGPPGPQGPTGPQGPAGPAGAQGANGAAGAQGPAGPTGPQGPTGATGAAGTQGPQGPAGASPWGLGSGNTYYTAGNVGVGIAAPTYPLHAVSSGPRVALFAAGSTSGPGFGAFGQVASSGAVGLVGWNTATTGEATGVQGIADSTAGRAVVGYSTASTGDAYGVWGYTASNGGTAVSGWAVAQTGVTTGVLGRTDSSTDEATGVYGAAAGTGGNTTGVWGLTQSEDSGAAGVYGQALGTAGENFGVFGGAESAAGYGVYCLGDFAASGTKAFQIDHPLDPANKVLMHYAAEGPQPFNIYRGNATLDESGRAVVELPAYFESINADLTYQLTAIGAPAPMLHVSAKAEGGRFEIGGGAANGEVSWCITAVRNDAWVRAKGAPTERAKPEKLRGRYLHPELQGAPGGASMYRRGPKATGTASPAPAGDMFGGGGPGEHDKAKEPG